MRPLTGSFNGSVSISQSCAFPSIRNNEYDARPLFGHLRGFFVCFLFFSVENHAVITLSMSQIAPCDTFEKPFLWNGARQTPLEAPRSPQVPTASVNRRTRPE